MLLLASVCAGSALADDGRWHVIREGQTLWSIAHSYGVKVDELMSINRIDDPTEVPSGMRLRIPGGSRLPSAPSALGPGRFGWPLRGVLTSGYGRRRGRLHAGMDIAAPRGTILVAAAPGRVIRGGDRWGRYGRVVLIEHEGGYKTLYAHLSRSFVSPGQLVARGQAIGAVGATGNATGPHLHFEVWRNGSTVNPRRLLPQR